MADRELPLVLATASANILLAALKAAAGRDVVLSRFLADPSVLTMVLALDVAGEPAARLVHVHRAPDPLAKWSDLSCI